MGLAHLGHAWLSLGRQYQHAHTHDVCTSMADTKSASLPLSLLLLQLMFHNQPLYQGRALSGTLSRMLKYLDDCSSDELKLELQTIAISHASYGGVYTSVGIYRLLLWSLLTSKEQSDHVDVCAICACALFLWGRDKRAQTNTPCSIRIFLFAVTPPMFGAFGQALVHAIATRLGDAFDDNVRKAWLATYTVVRCVDGFH